MTCLLIDSKTLRSPLPTSSVPPADKVAIQAAALKVQHLL